MNARKVSDDTRSDHFAKLLVERRETENVAGQNEAASLYLGVAYRYAFVPRAADGLFKKHVITLLERHHAGIVMKTVRKSDDHGVGGSIGLERILPTLPCRNIGIIRKLGDRIGESRDDEVFRMGFGIGRVSAAPYAVTENNRPYRSFHQTSTFQPLQSPSRLSVIPTPVPLANSIAFGSQSNPRSY